jgi:membrane-associated phospholipid phosphatase
MQRRTTERDSGIGESRAATRRCWRQRLVAVNTAVSRRTSLCLFALVSSVAVVPSRAAHAQVAPEADPNRSPYEVNVPLDVGITLGAMILGGMPRLFAKETVRPWCGLSCDPADVNPIDRTVIGYHSDVALQFSNVGFFGSMLLPFAFGAIDRGTSSPVDGTTGMLKDDLVLLETLSIVLVTNNVFSFIIRRPRPMVYDKNLTDEERLEPNNIFSYPSGHTAVAFGMATAYSRIYMQRHPGSGWVAPLWIGGYALAGMTGVLRTFSGDHFWTDVISGAATGIGLGLLVPWMHRRDAATADAEPIAMTGQGASFSIDPVDWATFLLR